MHITQWIDCFADNVRPLADSNMFPLNEVALKSFQLLKEELKHADLHSIQESMSFVMESDASGSAISATSHLEGPPVEFFLTHCKVVS